MWVAFIFIGIFSGVLAGLLGIGGGIIVVPSLFLLFHYLDLHAQHAMQVAVGTSLAAMTFTSFSSAVFHHLSKRVRWDYFYFLSPGIIFGTILGALAADLLPSRALGLFFGISLCLLGIHMIFFDKTTSAKINSESIHIPAKILIFGGVGIGFLSSLLGIGGGIMTVPLLTYFATPLKNAISTSAATGFLIALFGSVSFLFFGLNEDACPQCIGYLYPSAFIIIGIVSSIAAPIGVKLVHILPTKALKLTFGVILIAGGSWIFFINI